MNIRSTSLATLLLATTLSLSGCLSSTLGPADSASSLQQGKQSFINGDYYQAYKYLEPVARAGDPEAQYAVGYMYFYGLGIMQDKQAALTWMQSAAERGNPQAQQALVDIQADNGLRDATFIRGRGNSFNNQRRYQGGSRRGGGGAPAAVAGPNSATNVSATWPPPKDGATSPGLNSIPGPSTPEPAVKPSPSSYPTGVVGPDLSQTEPTTPSAANAMAKASTADAPQAMLSQGMEDMTLVTPTSGQVAIAAKSATATAQNMAKAKSPEHQAVTKEAMAQPAMPGQQAAAKQAMMHQQQLQEAMKQKAFSEHQAEVMAQAASQQPAIKTPQPVAPSRDKQPSQQQLSKGYTVQILGSYDRDYVNEFARKNQLQGVAQLYQYKRNGKDWYVLGYGNFESVSEAKDIADNLPGKLQKSHPWVRSMAGLSHYNNNLG